MSFEDELVTQRVSLTALAIDASELNARDISRIADHTCEHNVIRLIGVRLQRLDGLVRPISIGFDGLHIGEQHFDGLERDVDEIDADLLQSVGMQDLVAAVIDVLAAHLLAVDDTFDGHTVPFETVGDHADGVGTNQAFRQGRRLRVRRAVHGPHLQLLLQEQFISLIVGRLERKTVAAVHRGNDNYGVLVFGQGEISGREKAMSISKMP